MANIHKDSLLTFMYKVSSKKDMFLCQCGSIKEIRRGDVKDGHIKSCGCYKKIIDVVRHTKHGLSKHPLYNTWKAMIERCYTATNKQYPDYGGRSVLVCDAWKNDFMAYYTWAVENGWKKGLHIDKDIIGTGFLYSPETCCCVTRKENNRVKRDVVKLEYLGQFKNLNEWAQIYGIKYKVVWDRINKFEWDLHKALTEPVKNSKVSKKV